MKSTFLTAIVILSFAVTVGYRYYDYVVEQNITIFVYAPCNPEVESCFIADEESAWTDIQLTPYKKVELSKKYAPKCLEEFACDTFACGDISDCSETLCNDENLDEGEYCVEETIPEPDVDALLENSSIIDLSKSLSESTDNASSTSTSTEEVNNN